LSAIDAIYFRWKTSFSLISEFKKAGFKMHNIAFVLDPKNPNVKQIKSNLDDALRELAKNGVVSVKASNVMCKRTLQQNSYYWTLIGILAEFAGYDKEDISEYFLKELGFTRISKTWKGETEKALSTTKLNSTQFSELIEAVIERLIANDLNYPQPSYYGYEA
jgi:hypothetical protein